MMLWKKKGPQRGIAEIFPWSYAQYLEFANTCGASWFSSPDLCCEPEISSSPEEVDFRIRATATLLEGCLQTLYAWANELAKTCDASTVAYLVRPPVPVLQGWAASDYLRSLDLLHQVWQRWEPWLAQPALIGLGSVCRRSVNHPTHGLLAILEALGPQLPKEAKLHLFGVKGTCLDSVKRMPFIASADSMAYDFGARMRAVKAGKSNTLENRCAEMTRWMSAAAQRIDIGPVGKLRMFG